jgi:putative membrane protein
MVTRPNALWLAAERQSVWRMAARATGDPATQDRVAALPVVPHLQIIPYQHSQVGRCDGGLRRRRCQLRPPGKGLSPWERARTRAGGATESRDSQHTTAGDGTEPDARFTLANERTFLAWNRTALALVVAGLGIIQLLPPFPGVPWGRHVLGIPLIVLGAAVSMIAYREWLRVRYALRHGAPLPRSVLPVVLATTIAGIATLSAVVLLISAIR